MPQIKKCFDFRFALLSVVYYIAYVSVAYMTLHKLCKQHAGLLCTQNIEIR